MPYKNPDDHREYQKLRSRARRKEWITENGPCNHCGSWKNLEIDHIDPGKKKMNPGGLWNRKKSDRDKELAKCQALCKKCHRKKTSSEQLRSPHGTTGRYDRYGCRCAKCRKAKNIKKNEWRWRTGLHKKRKQKGP